MPGHEHTADNFDHFSFLDWCAGKGTDASHCSSDCLVILLACPNWNL
jgi:hypothetical protein